ncbi:capsule biosynthesis GfcC family protein [Vibrio metschnikovii]|nr:capsule biosynthesis GfcC family protein [Vibrio metschnikovii]EKO3635517.1 capsule biosynthesis GfcC family protein [Vibrio metschnikovii]
MRFALLFVPFWLLVSQSSLASTPVSHPISGSRSNDSTFSAQVALSTAPPMLNLVAEGPVRLEAMMMEALHAQQPILSTLQVDWQRAALFTLNAPFTQQTQVLERLAEQQDKVSEVQAQAWEQLRTQLRRSEFAQREFIPLDPDVIRVVDRHNPLLKGHFALHLPLLSDQASVSVWGAINEPTRFEWQANFSAKDYAQQAQWINPRLSTVVVIQPNGDVQSHPVGYWQSQSLSVQPGAIIYVPFTRSLLASLSRSELAQTNQQVVELLSHLLPNE